MSSVGLEVLYFVWQCIQNYIFLKSQDEPHKFLIFNQVILTLNEFRKKIPLACLPKNNKSNLPYFFLKSVRTFISFGTNHLQQHQQHYPQHQQNHHPKRNQHKQGCHHFAQFLAKFLIVWLFILLKNEAFFTNLKKKKI